MTEAADPYLEMAERLRHEGPTVEVSATWRQAYERVSANQLVDMEDVALMTKLGVSIYLAAHEYGTAVEVARGLQHDPPCHSFPEPHALDLRCLLAYALFCDSREEQAIAEWTLVLRETRRRYRRVARSAVRATLVEALLFCPRRGDGHATSEQLRDLVRELLVAFIGRRRSVAATTAATSGGLVDLLLSTWPHGQEQLPLFHATIDRASLRVIHEPAP